MRRYNIPVFIPHEGCPHDCVFCNQRKITGVETSVSPSDAEEIIKEHLGYFPEGKRYVEVAFFGGSFTGLPISLQEEFYKSANKFKGQVDGIRLSTRPDYINDEILDLAKRYGVTMIELGAQSTSDIVLEKNNRAHTFAATKKAVKLIKSFGIKVGLQMMTGMYGSDGDTDIKSAKELVSLKPDCARIYPVLVLRDTALCQLYLKGEYKPQSLEEAIETAKKVLLEFKAKEIPVIRIGLHSGEDLREEGTVVAGPFHPAFGELVENRIYRDKIEEEILKLKNIPKNLVIEAPKNEVSKMVGQKRCNIEYFKEKYGLNIKVLEKGR